MANGNGTLAGKCFQVQVTGGARRCKKKQRKVEETTIRITFNGNVKTFPKISGILTQPRGDFYKKVLAWLKSINVEAEQKQIRPPIDKAWQDHVATLR